MHHNYTYSCVFFLVKKVLSVDKYEIVYGHVVKNILGDFQIGKIKH